MQDPKFEQLIDYMASRMMIILASPEQVLIKEGDTLQDNENMY